MKSFNTYKEAREDMEKGALEVHHEITWWIETPLTLEEWSALDDAMDEAFAKVLKGDRRDKYVGIAGPIPL